MISEIHNYAELCRFTRETHHCVLKASASWCGPCKRIAPFYSNLSTNYPSVSFGEFDVDKAPEVAKFYRTASMPTFYFIKNGQVVDTIISAAPQNIQRALSNFTRINTS